MYSFQQNDRRDNDGWYRRKMNTGPISIDDIETQFEELQDRVRAAALKDRKAIIESVTPSDQPFGIEIWPDGKIDIRGAIPVSAADPVAKPSRLPGQEP